MASRALKIQKKIFHMAYSIGASVVILGALGKILHMPIFGIPGATLLMVGLGVEAAIFFISAFEPTEQELDWSIVYPELAGGKSKGDKKAKGSEDADAMLSQKLDNMLREAKLDVGVMKNLSSSIQNFKGAAEQIQPAVDSIAATKQYSEQLSLASNQMKSLNNLYKSQLESTTKQAQVNEDITKNASLLNKQMKSMGEQFAVGTSQMESLNSLFKLQSETVSKQARANDEIAKNAAVLKEQMQSMSVNLQNLNNVYGGMLSAMTRK